MSKKTIKEVAATPAPAAPAQQQGEQGEHKSPAVERLEKKFSSIKLDDLLGAIKQKDQAVGVLALIASKFDMSQKGSDLLKKATIEALEAEKEEQKAPAALEESFKSVDHFVGYLFESKRHSK